MCNRQPSVGLADFLEISMAYSKIVVADELDEEYLFDDNYEEKQMNQTKKTIEAQVKYMGRLVSKKHFRAYVYNDKGEKKLANSYGEYAQLVGMGNWFDSATDAKKSKKAKKKVDSTESETGTQLDQTDDADSDDEEESTGEVIEYGTDR